MAQKMTASSMLAKWRNRPKYKKITRELIRCLPDDRLEWSIGDYLWCRVGKRQRVSNVLTKLPQGYTVIYYSLTMDNQVRNGGFNQYFFNGYGKSAPEHLEALKRLRAFKHRRILQKAIRIHTLEEKNEELQRRYAERTIGAFFSTYDLTELGVCDKEWFALKTDLRASQVRYIRKHPEFFVTG